MSINDLSLFGKICFFSIIAVSIWNVTKLPFYLAPKLECATSLDVNKQYEPGQNILGYEYWKRGLEGSANVIYLTNLSFRYIS